MSTSDNLGGIDTQHRKLAERGRAICNLLEEKGTYQDLKAALIMFLELTRSHFSEEEQLMRRYGYEGFESHRRTHKILLDKLDELVQETNRSFTPSTEARLLEFLQRDVCYHIVEDTHAWESGEIEKRFAYERLNNQAATVPEPG